MVYPRGFVACHGGPPWADPRIPTRTCSRRSTLGFTTLKNRVLMGSMHTGPRGGAERLRQARRVLRRARAGGVGPDRHRRHCAELRRTRRAPCLAAVVRVAGGEAPHHHRRRARRRRQDRAADPARRPLRLSPAVGRAVGAQVADHAVSAARADAAGACAGRSPTTCAARSSRSAPATTASRSWAPRAT